MSLTGDLSFNSVASVSVSQHKGRIFWRWGPHLLYNTNQLGNLFSKFLAAFKMIGLNGFSIVIYFELFYSVFEVKKKKNSKCWWEDVFPEISHWKPASNGSVPLIKFNWEIHLDVTLIMKLRNYWLAYTRMTSRTKIYM